MDESRFRELVEGPVDESRFRGTCLGRNYSTRHARVEGRHGRVAALRKRLRCGPIPAISAATATCQMCGRAVGADNLIELAGVRTCAECKPKVVQAISEGGQLAASTVWRGWQKDCGHGWCALSCPVREVQPSDRGTCLEAQALLAQPRVLSLIFLQVILYVIVAMQVRKRATVEIHLCREHLNRRRNFIIGVWISLVLGLAGLIWGISQSQGLMILAGIVLLVVALTLGVFGARPLATVKIRDKTVWLKGAGKDFLASLPSWNG